MLHLRNMVERIIHLFDWILCGYITDMTYQRNAYRKAYREKLEICKKANKELTDAYAEINELRDSLKYFKEKQNAQRAYHRQWYHKNKKK